MSLLPYRFVPFLSVVSFIFLRTTTAAWSSLSSSEEQQHRFTWRRAVTADDVRACQALRMRIFVTEQGIAAATELDGQDNKAVHVMCHCCDDGRLVATGRLLLESLSQDEKEGATMDDNLPTLNAAAANGIDDDDYLDPPSSKEVVQAHFGRIAVDAEFRGQGLGRAVIQHLEMYARTDIRSAHDATVVRRMIRCSLTPHAHLETFYTKLGYTVVAGTTPQRMSDSFTSIQMEKWLTADRP